MADCCSLPNAAELMEELRDLEYAKGNALSWITKAKMRSLMLEAADAIEADRMEIAGLRMRRDELYKKIDKLEAENARLKNENEQLKQAAEKEVHNNIQENPCIGCNHGWGSISAEKVTSCVESCAEYKLYCKQQLQPPKEEEDGKIH